MCDYSQTVNARRLCTRKAKVGDELDLVQLGSGVWGFMKWKQGEGFKPGRSWHGRGVVTCLRPGTEIVFERRFVIPTSRSNIVCDNGEVINVADITPGLEARTGTVWTSGRLRYSSDVVEFPSGLQMGLAAVPLHMQVRVLQLPVVKRRKAKVEAKVEAKRELELVER